MTIREQVDSFQRVLDTYTTSLKLNIKCPDVVRYLDYTADDLRGLSAEDCNIGAGILVRYSVYLTKEQNRHHNLENWASHNLNLMLAKEPDNYGDKWVKWENKIHMLIVNNAAAQQLDEIIKHAKGRVTELNFLSNQVNLIAKTLTDLAYSKRKAAYAD